MGSNISLNRDFLGLSSLLVHMLEVSLLLLLASYDLLRGCHSFQCSNVLVRASWPWCLHIFLVVGLLRAYYPLWYPQYTWVQSGQKSSVTLRIADSRAARIVRGVCGVTGDLNSWPYACKAIALSPCTFAPGPHFVINFNQQHCILF